MRGVGAKDYRVRMANGNQIVSRWDAGSAKATANAAAVRALVKEVRGQEAQIREGGGKKAVEAQHAKGRLTARERIGVAGGSGWQWECNGKYRGPSLRSG